MINLIFMPSIKEKKSSLSTINNLITTFEKNIDLQDEEL